MSGEGHSIAPTAAPERPESGAPGHVGGDPTWLGPMAGDAILALQRVAEAMRSGHAPAPADRERVAQVLGLRALDPVTERDWLVVAAMARFFPTLTARGRAEAFALRWLRYAAAGWLRDRTAETMPPRIAG